jgi:hypothetical protein
MSIAYLKDVPLWDRIEAVRALAKMGEDPTELMLAALDPGEASTLLQDPRTVRHSSAPSCIRGHEWTFSNTYIRKDGRRLCRECQNIRWQRRKKKEKARKR